jgi:hypothetical protein
MHLVATALAALVVASGRSQNPSEGGGIGILAIVIIVAAVLVAAGLLFLPFVPAIFRYSRVIWMHFDRALDPGD